MIPLCVRSHYSLMWATPSIKNLCNHAARLGYDRLALTDTDNLYGMWSFITECRHHGISPIIGAEITDPNTPHRAVCLAKTRKGFSNLTRLLTRRHREPDFRLKDRLPEFGRGLLVLTKSPALLASWHDQGVDLAAHIPRTPSPGHRELCRTAQKRNLPVTASPGSFFLHPGDHPLHTLVRTIDKKSCLGRLSRADQVPANAFLGSPDLYFRRFQTLAQTLAASRDLAERIEFQGPDFGIVMPPLQGETRPASLVLREKTLEGAAGRYGRPLPLKAAERIDHELAIIQEKNFCQYFLVVQDIVSRASRICGRGSGAASIVAYCLRITNVCPIKHNLYFERFLNPDRKDPPDIDIDFAWDERDLILDRVLKKFSGHSAMVASHILFQPRMAVRETARVFGLPDPEISRVSKRLPWFWHQDQADQGLLEAVRKDPKFRFMEFPEPWPKIMAFAQALTGTPRHLSVHPGGIVITPEPMDHYVPIQTAPKGVPLIQWDKDGAEAAGLVKIDLLGNRSLGVIRDTVTSIRTETGKFDDFDLMDPEDDFETQQTVAQGHTMGCFYIESPATRLLQKKSKIGDFDHVVIHSSIIRPAANDYIKIYLERLHTGVWEPIHPLIGDLLDETFGIMVYQEDVSRVAVKMAGFSHAKADGLRKIMSKKDKTRELADYFQQFSMGAAQKGASPRDIQKVWEMIVSFSGYSFCKPHSASYARISFQAAYLKTHYPAPFMAAVISNQGGFYSAFAYVSEARRLGLTILAPDILESDIPWKGRGQTLRVGLMAIKNLSGSAMEQILTERKKADFTGLEDFLDRVRPRRDDARALIHSGSLDRFRQGQSRGVLSWAFACWHSRSKDPGPALFPVPGPAPDLPDLPPDKSLDILQQEFSALGFLCDSHPILLYRESVERENTVKADHLPGHIGKTVKFAGWLISGKTVQTKQGDPMKFLTFEDETGLVETVFFPGPYARFCHMLDYGRPYLLRGKVESDWGAVTLTVTSTRPMDKIQKCKLSDSYFPSNARLKR
ncbi:DNA polymerase III subunit alpha [Desulfospira joergensenii]|uniref:DNA polymerase III subunit alpha n=1 Tax=Desulfospira joergensenii TaxID=53329 RepID=UPI0003B4D5AC|nr:DNA polymerase III subunit alpha [Desulfospira joergensenii]